MQLRNFTKLLNYINRPGYSETVLSILAHHIEAEQGPVEAVADVGAGTGKLTENLAHLGL